MNVSDRASSPASPRAFRRNRTTPRCADLEATLPLAPAIRPEPRDALAMKCLYCLSPIERGTAEVRVHRNGFHLDLRTVPAWVCSRCEQAYFEPHEVEMVRLAVSAMSRLGT